VVNEYDMSANEYEYEYGYSKWGINHWTQKFAFFPFCFFAVVSFSVDLIKCRSQFRHTNTYRCADTHRNTRCITLRIRNVEQNIFDVLLSCELYVV